MIHETRPAPVAAYLLLATVLLVAPAFAAGGADTLPADGGEIEITPILHASVQFVFDGMTIQVDPWSRGDYGDGPSADLILVTDVHGDHMDVEMISRLRGEDTVVVAPAAVAETVKDAHVIANGEAMKIAGIGVEAVPMYNLERGPEEGKLFHEKGRGNGYILYLGGRRIYLAGDTACIPEMRALEDIDLAFVPMNLPYTMTPAEAAECVRAFKPAVVYPYHYRGSDLDEFTAALADLPEVEVRIRDWYPGS